jgi:hypothetical protein
MELKFRDLLKEEIELRVGSTNDSGFQLLLYKNARVDMQLLDEVVGVGNWQREHIILGNDIYCRLGIWNSELNQWVWKTDAGSSGTIEEEKSKASDSFKRAATNFGLGRCLYSAPFVWVVTKTKEGVLTGETKKDRYVVDEIDYTDHKITKLVIKNEKTHKVVFSMGSSQKVSTNGENNPKTTSGSGKGTIRPSEKDLIAKLIAGFNAEELDLFIKWLNERYHTTNYLDLSDEEGLMVAAKWKSKVK